MSRDDGPSRGDGARTAASGTAFPVDFTRDRRARITWLLFLAGPVIWISHFMLVYLVAEAGCTSGGPGFEVFDPPVTVIVTLVATAVATAACGLFAFWAYRRWQYSRSDPDHDDGRTGMAHAGMLLSLLSIFAILLEGLSALVFTGC